MASLVIAVVLAALLMNADDDRPGLDLIGWTLVALNVVFGLIDLFGPTPAKAATLALTDDKVTEALIGVLLVAPLVTMTVIGALFLAMRWAAGKKGFYF